MVPSTRPIPTDTLRFPWNEARAALLAAMPDEDGVRRHRYTRPSGLPALDLVDCHLWHLTGDQTVQIPAANSNSICLVIEGPGESLVGDHNFLWETRDVFSVPPWKFGHISGTRWGRDPVCWL